jgi:hypothetical protein
LLIYVLYPLTVAGVISVFGIIYRVFSSLIERMNQHEITVTIHHERISNLEKMTR